MRKLVFNRCTPNGAVGTLEVYTQAQELHAFISTSSLALRYVSGGSQGARSVAPQSSTPLMLCQSGSHICGESASIVLCSKFRYRPTMTYHIDPHSFPVIRNSVNFRSLFLRGRIVDEESKARPTRHVHCDAKQTFCSTAIAYLLLNPKSSYWLTLFSS